MTSISHLNLESREDQGPSRKEPEAGGGLVFNRSDCILLLRVAIPVKNGSTIAWPAASVPGFEVTVSCPSPFAQTKLR